MGVSVGNDTLHPIRGIESTKKIASPRSIHGRYVAWNYCEYLNPDRDSHPYCLNWPVATVRDSFSMAKNDDNGFSLGFERGIHYQAQAG